VLNAAIGAQITARSPFAISFFSGYTNGVEMYMATADAYPEDYEIWMTPFAPEAAGLTFEESRVKFAEVVAFEFPGSPHWPCAGRSGVYGRS
jgi:hypothetical protein